MPSANEDLKEKAKELAGDFLAPIIIDHYLSKVDNVAKLLMHLLFEGVINQFLLNLLIQRLNLYDKKGLCFWEVKKESLQKTNLLSLKAVKEMEELRKNLVKMINSQRSIFYKIPTFAREQILDLYRQDIEDRKPLFPSFSEPRNSRPPLEMAVIAYILLSLKA